MGHYGEIVITVKNSFVVFHGQLGKGGRMVIGGKESKRGVLF